MKQNDNAKSTAEDGSLGPCQICGREMLPGESVDRHLWQPKSRGGKQAEYLHRICHRKLHSLFTEKELDYSFSKRFPYQHLAARFAAKEAVAKALGWPIVLY